MRQFVFFFFVGAIIFGFSQNWKGNCDDFINEFNSGDYEKAKQTGERCRMILEDEFEKEDTSYCNVLYYLGYAHYYTESYQKAVEYAKEELELRLKIQGDQNMNYITACYNYAVFSTYTKDYKSAIAYMSKVYSFYQNQFGKENEYTIQIAIQYANILDLAGTFELAKKVYEKAYEEVKDHYTISDSLFQAMTNTVSAFYYTHGMYDLCVPFFEDALKYQERAVGKESETYIMTLNSTGEFYINAGMLDKAENIFDEHIEVAAKYYGKKSETYLLILNSVGEYCLNAGLLKKSEDVFRLQLECSAKFYGKKSPDYATALNNLAVTLENQEKFDEADELYQQALKIKAQVFKKESSFYALTLMNYGILKYRMGQSKKSEDLLTEAMGIYEKTLSQNSSEYIMASSRLAQIWQGYGAYEKALASLNKSIDVTMANIGHENLEFVALAEIKADVLKSKGDFLKSEQWYYNALSIREKVQGKTHPDYIATLSRIASLQSAMGEQNASEKLWREILKIQMENLETMGVGIANTYSELANVLFLKGNIQEAKGFHELALISAKGNVGEMHPDYIQFLVSAGYFYQEIGDLDQSFDLYSEALRKAKLSFDSESYEIHNIHQHLGGLYLRKGDFKSAEESFRNSLEILKSTVGLNHPDYANVLISMGVLYYELGNYKKAELRYADAQPLIKELYGDEHQEYATLCSNIGALYLMMGSDSENPTDVKLYFDQSENFYLKALAIDSLNGWMKAGLRTLDHSIHLNNLAELRRYQNRAEEAEKLYLASMGIEHELLGEFNLNSISSYTNLAMLNLGMQRLDKAEEYARKSIHSFNENYSKNALRIPRSWAILAHIHAVKGENQSAFQLHQRILTKNIEVVQNNFAFLSEEEKSNYFEEYRWNRNNYFQFLHDYKYQDEKVGQLAYDLALFEKGLLLKSTREMRDLIEDSKDEETIEKYGHWLGLKQELAKLYAEPNSATELQYQIEERCNNLEKELLAILVKGQISRQKKINWHTLSSSLNENEVAIEFIQFSSSFYIGKNLDRYAAIVLRKGQGPEYLDLFSTKDLESIIGTVGGNNVVYVNQLYGTKAQLNTELYELIWKQIEPQLTQSERVYFTPAGILNKVSFAALSDSSGNYLSEKYELIQMNSTGQLVLKKKELVNKKWDVTLFGGAQYSLENTEHEVWNYLEGTLNETKNIGQLLNKAKFQVNNKLEIEATEDNLKACSGDLAPRILHIATHGFFYPDPLALAKIEEKEVEDVNFRGGSRGHDAFVKNINPLMRSGLVLTGANNVWNDEKDTLDFENQMNVEDGVVTAFEISALDLSNTDLAVLSACETGLGDIKGSEGVYGLQRAFKIAGVQSLIMSLWQVPDKETEEFMTLFYSNLVKEKNVRKSFLMTQSALRKKYDPYYWAAFVLVE